LYFCFYSFLRISVTLWFNYSTDSALESRTSRHLGALRIRPFFPTCRAMRNKLNGNSFRFRACLISYVVYVSAAQVSEGLPNTVSLGRTVVLVNCDRSLRHRDQTWPGMSMPANLPVRLKCILGDVEIRVPFTFVLRSQSKSRFCTANRASRPERSLLSQDLEC
jgi:hypothetical protein